MNKNRTIYVTDSNRIVDHIEWLKSIRVNRHNYRLFPAKFINLDFSKSKFLKPYHITSLACVIQEYLFEDFKVRIVKKNKSQVLDYLDKFNFQSVCERNDEFNWNMIKDPKILPLWRINQARINLFPTDVQKYYEDNHINGKDLFVLSNSMAELMNNVFDHAHSQIPGFTFTQYNTQNNTIITSICDFGKGIPRMVNDYLKKNGKPSLNSKEALKTALETEFSTKTNPHNRGFGWNTIFSSIKSINSKILVVSNDALYWLREDENIVCCKINANFPGTLVVVYINTLNLSAKEEISDEVLIL